MFLFAFYACGVWYLALRFRRQWPAFVIVPAAAGVTALLVPVLMAANVADVGLYLMLSAEAVVILLVGLFIAILPRAPKHPHCAYCRYDLRGLVGETGRAVSDGPQQCPECGMPIDGFASVRRQRAKVFASATDVQPLNGRDVAAEVRSMSAAANGGPARGEL